MSAQRLVFPEAFKREAVDRVANSGLSAGGTQKRRSDFSDACCTTSRRSR
jgi:hypothetical protein